ncbi:MAG: MFS transporter [Candidatus Bathyarchaeia archaeon]
MKPRTHQATIRELVAVYTAIFSISMGVGMVTPIIPLYARSLGASYVGIGLIGTSYAIVYMMLAIPSGKLSDRIGRRVVIAASASLSGVASVLYLLAGSVSHLILIRAIDGMAWTLFWPSIEALTTEISGPPSAGKGMGLSAASYGFGSMVGGFLGGLIVTCFGFRATFVLYLTLSIVTALLTVAIREEGDSRRSFKARGTSSTQPLTWDKATLVVACAVSVAYSIVLAIVLTLFPVYAEGLGMETFWIGVLFATFWLGRIISFICAGRLSDKLGRNAVLAPALAGSAVASLLVALSGEIGLLSGAILIMGISLGATFPVTIALISDVAPSSSRGVAMGLFEASSGLGMLIGPAVGGVMAEMFDPRYPYFLCMFISAGCSLVVLTRLREFAI